MSRPGRHFEYEDLAVNILAEEWQETLSSFLDRGAWLRWCEDKAEAFLEKHGGLSFKVRGVLGRDVVAKLRGT